VEFAMPSEDKLAALKVGTSLGLSYLNYPTLSAEVNCMLTRMPYEIV
jgi:hypothetical protein